MRYKKTRKFFPSCFILCFCFVILGGGYGCWAEDLSRTEFDENGLITINFKDTDILEVLNILAYKGKVNIVAGTDVNAKVSVQLKDVPWDQALDVILKTYNFTYKQEGNLIRVMSLQRSLEEEEKIPLVTSIIPLNFASVDLLKDSLSKILSRRGNIQSDKRTNSLIITDIPEVVVAVEQAARTLDSRTPQVLIEAMMVDVVLSDEDRFGVSWDITSKGGNNYVQSLSSSFSAGFEFYGVLDDINIHGLVDFLRMQNKAQILANPRVLTLDNQEAKIEIVEEIPYLETVDTGGGQTTNVKFRDAGVKLFVTPHITTGEYISMNVKPEQSFKSGEIQGQPIISSRKAETNLLVKDGQTIVIGGLRKTNDNITYDKIPILGDVPILGFFFKRKIIAKVETELLLFVTPHVIHAPVMSDREIEWLKSFKDRKQIKIDERSEIEKFRDWMKSRRKQKAAEEKALEQAIQRQDVSAESGFGTEARQDEYPTHRRTEQQGDLDREERKFDQAMEKLKKDLEFKEGLENK